MPPEDTNLSSALYYATNHPELYELLKNVQESRPMVHDALRRKALEEVTALLNWLAQAATCGAQTVNLVHQLLEEMKPYLDEDGCAAVATIERETLSMAAGIQSPIVGLVGIERDRPDPG